MKNKYLLSFSHNGIRTPFIDVVIKSLLQILASICPFITEKDKILMELLPYSSIVSISDWKYTKSVGIKNQVFWASPCSYTDINLSVRLSGMNFAVKKVNYDSYCHIKYQMEAERKDSKEKYMFCEVVLY